MRRALLWCREAVYRWMVDADFRDAYGSEVDLLFEELLEDAERRGRLAMLGVWWLEVRQVLRVRALSRADSRASLVGAGSRVRSIPAWIETLTRDLRLASHTLSRRALYSVSVLLTLSVGVGLVVAVYSAARVSVLAPMPVSEPDRTVIVTGWESTERWTGRPGLSVVELQEMEAAASIEDLALFSLTGDATLRGRDHSERLRVSYVSPDYFQIIGAAPELGRVFDGATPEAAELIISHATWKRSFGSDPEVIGRPLSLSGVEYVVVGVMPPSHWGLARGPGEFDAWAPLDRSPDIFGADILDSFYRGYFWAVAQLRPGVTLGEADQDLAQLYEARFGDRPIPVERTAKVMGLGEYYFGGTRLPAAMIGLGALFVLLVCATNVALLVALRQDQRREELSVRAALGAGRSRLVQTSLVEGALLGALGGVASLGVARLAVMWLAIRHPNAFMRFDDVAIDPTTALTAILLSLFISAAAGLIASGHTSRMLSRRPTADRFRRRRFPGLVLASEGAVAVCVLVGAWLALNSLRQLDRVELGYEPEGLSSARVSLVGTQYRGGGPVEAFARELHDRMEGMGSQPALLGPDMMGRSVTHVTAVPAGLDPTDIANVTRVQWVSLTPGSLEILGAQILAGRDVEWSDRAGTSKVALLSQRAAEALWPGESAVGKRMHVSGSRTPEVEVIGVVADARHQSRYARPYASGEIYLPLGQRPTDRVSVLFRADGTGIGYGSVSGMLRDIDPALALYDRRSMAERVDTEAGTLRLVTGLLSLYAGIALFLGGCGVVSLVATTLGERRFDIAIRGALGARPLQLAWSFIRPPLVWIAVGVLMGTLLAALVTPYLEPVLFGVSIDNWVVHLTAAGGVLSLAGLASWAVAARFTTRSPLAEIRT